MNSRPDTSFRILGLVARLAASALMTAACADTAQEPTPEQRVSITTSSVGGSDPLVCVPDEALLDAMEHQTMNCDPEEAEPDPQVPPTPQAVMDGCAGPQGTPHPDAFCDPLHGYMCMGSVTYVPPGGAACPPGLVDVDDDNATYYECVGPLHRACQQDVDCPTGSFCDASRGGVCYFACRSNSDCVDNGEICDRCVGRCEGWQDLGPSLQRPVLYVTPDALEFTALDIVDDNATRDEARRLTVSLSNPRPVEPQEVHVVAARGFMVACDPENPNGSPAVSEYAAECTLTVTGLGRRNHVWVLPYDLVTPRSLTSS